MTGWRRRIALVALAVWSVSASGAGAQSQDQVPAAYADAGWWPGYARDLEYATTWLGLYRVVGTERPVSVRTPGFTMTDGVRHSWSPPECDCRRLRVWVYGSATALGLGQRDGHTVASELARAAWADGVAVDVVNRGVAGDQHWQAANRLGRDLTVSPPPDLVIFYDGVSDVNAARFLDERSLGDVDRAVRPLTEDFLADPELSEVIRSELRGSGEVPPMPEGMSVAEPEPVPAMTPAEVGRLAVRRYERARVMSRDLVDVYGLDAMWVWEPMRLLRPPVEGEPEIEGDGELRTVVRAAQGALADDVVDLGSLLGPELGPVYYDDVHHNEVAARVAAEAIYDLVAPILRERSGAR